MKIFPVVHINERETAVEQASTALSYGADGVYLIDHCAESEDLTFKVLEDLKAQDGESFVGLNFLGLSTSQVFEVIDRALTSGRIHHIPDAIWLDNVSRAETVEAVKDRYKQLSSIRVLGGVAFKYTREFTEDPEAAKDEVLRNYNKTDVITTSGSGTGTPPTVEKIAAMKEVAGGKPIVLASGVDVNNISDYDGLADEILAASSVETHKYSGVFDQDKLRSLINRAHEL